MSLQCVQRNNQQFSATKLIVPANTPAAVNAVLFERFVMQFYLSDLGCIFRPKKNLNCHLLKVLGRI